MQLFTFPPRQKKKNVVINLLAAAKSHYSPPGRDSRRAHPAPKKKTLQNLTRHLPVKCGINKRTCMLRKCGRLPLLRRLQLRPRICACQRWKDARMLAFFFPLHSLPRRVYSSQPPAKPEGKLNDSVSTFGRCWEYVGLCSISEPLDSCRESPAARGPPEDTRPFQTVEGAECTFSAQQYH